MTKLKQSLCMGQSRLSGVKTTPLVGTAIALMGMILYLLTAPMTNAQAPNGITEPESGAALSGIVTIRGTATHGQFLRYELAFSSGGDWLVFAESDSPVVNGSLAIWDTTVGYPSNPIFPDGVYRLRLRVVRQDYNYDEYFVNNLVVSNAMTPTPTETATPEGGVTQTPGAPAPPDAAEASATSGFIIVRPTPLASLTPFPTPSAAAVPGGVVVARTPPAPGSEPPGGGDGLLQRALSVDTDRFGQAFWQGARLSLLAFVLLALYLVLRAILRFLWPRLWMRIKREE